VTVRAAFLDRDGTLNVDHGYVHRHEDWQWMPGALESLAALNRMGLKVVVVSNQSGVARGYFKEDAVRRLHDWVAKDAAAHGARIDAFYYCPHLDGCDCRKPSPGMLLRAAHDMSIDLAGSYMVGDSPRDAEAGVAAGTTAILLGAATGTCASAVLRAPGWPEAMALICDREESKI
jgi:D-glycero-D-manno-heptose 1,7-bisphosphate phosphatase